MIAGACTVTALMPWATGNGAIVATFVGPSPAGGGAVDDEISMAPVPKWLEFAILPFAIPTG